MSQESREVPEIILPEHPLKYRVIVEYQASNPDPISIDAGEILYVSEKVDAWNNNPDWIYIWCTDQRGKKGWVPQNAINFNTDHTKGTARYSYAATELTVNVGDELTASRVESGWLWCMDRQGACGWVPLAHVTPLPV